MKPEIDDNALLGSSAKVGSGSRIWGLAQVREDAVIGANCVIGRGVYIGAGVRIGKNCKIQNSALIYEPASIGNGVFIGPGVVLTNDRFPRAINPDGTQKSSGDWAAAGVVIEDGASVGAGSVCVGPARIGSWSVIGAGSIVTKDVSPYALMVGAPARQVGWVGPAGVRLKRNGTFLVCPQTGELFVENSGQLKPHKTC